MTQPQIRTLGIYLTIALFFLILDTLGYLNPVKSVAQIAMLPAESAAHAVSGAIDETFSFFTFWRSGETRIKYLEERNLELTVQANKAAALEAENNVLRTQLGSGTKNLPTLLPASVLGINRYLSINVGSNNLVEVNMPVIYLGSYIGRIIKVTPRNSFIELPSDANAKIPVKVGINGTVRGLISGQYNSSIILDHVSQDEEIKVDDLVYTEDSLLIGKIQTINSKEADLFKQATVKPAVDASHLATVFVVLK